MISLKIAKNQSDFEKIYHQRFRVFCSEKKLIDSKEGQKYTDAWDSFSINTFVNFNNLIVGSGRIILFNDKVGFRVSSSIDLNNYFDDLSNVLEISGLLINKEFRHKNYGNAIHLFRIKIAQELGCSYLIAAVFPETAKYLIDMGFSIYCDSFDYKHYSTDTKSQFLVFDLCSNSAINRMEDYFTIKLGALKNVVLESINNEKLWLTNKT